MALTFLTVAGPIFTCCRINAAITEALVEIIRHTTHPGEGRVSHQDGPTHAGCHGHGRPAGSESPSSPDFGPGTHVEPDEDCLSKTAVTQLALQSTPLDLSLPVLWAPHLIAATQPAFPPRFDHPKPQNKSSPPLYLLTLRLLV